MLSCFHDFARLAIAVAGRIVDIPLCPSVYKTLALAFSIWYIVAQWDNV
jgi:hypothetical protein